MSSSIFDDLKKLGGNIKAKKVTNALPGLDIEELSGSGSDDEAEIKNVNINAKVKKAVAAKKPAAVVQAAPPAQPEITVDAIAAMIKPPITPLRDANGFVHDASTIAAKCTRGHIHKYFLKDITTAGGISKCLTCSAGNKFMIMVREFAENTLGVPFVLAEKRLDPEANAIEFTNPVLKITLETSRIAGADAAVMVNDHILIKLHPTTSLKKIKDALGTHLAAHPTLNDDQKAKIAALKPAAAKGKKKVYQKDPLPVTPELAILNAQANGNNPILAQLQVNVVTEDTEKLCLENC